MHASLIAPPLLQHFLQHEWCLSIYISWNESRISQNQELYLESLIFLLTTTIHQKKTWFRASLLLINHWHKFLSLPQMGEKGSPVKVRLSSLPPSNRDWKGLWGVTLGWEGIRSTRLIDRQTGERASVQWREGRGEWEHLPSWLTWARWQDVDWSRNLRDALCGQTDAKAQPRRGWAVLRQMVNT